MKKYLGDSLGCLGIAMALYAALWTILCEKFGFISFAGFAGCTTFFACGENGLKGVKTAAIVNVSGIFWAMAAIWLGMLWDFPYSGAVYCAIVSYAIIKQAEFKWFKFIPGAYIGCFTTFAAEGKWQNVVISAFIGILIGWLTQISGGWLYHKSNPCK